ncbi:1,2-dihydroxy-3-keto-5-methylthiopentene dioxygenase [Leptolyngbya ohadii]|uniref:1,2-dihydroxy-3-keto-5-methylthiopentene dioxygenase n=1 Tax=Leptolyngbya ohadii TaxID=1962290 RepID=UPI000B5A19E8|nr:cupin domain-containing protein [Leptolyngbya ohadii]
MAVLTIPEENRQITDSAEIEAYLKAIGIGFAQWEPSHPLSETASSEEILAAYAPEIEALKQQGGYVTADVIDIKPDTPNLDGMLAKFSREHSHAEDEVRFTIEGHGLFHINPQTSPVVSIQVEAGDLLVVPEGTLHWFDLCGDRRIRAIRLFQEMAGWTPHYTESGKEQGFVPLCFSPKAMEMVEAGQQCDRRV